MQTQNVTENAGTVIIGQRVRRGTEKEFLTWQHGLNDAASSYPGFLGAEVTAPTDDQSEWVVIYRFDSAANLRAWLNSAARLDRLAIGEQYLDGPATQQIVGGTPTPADQLVTVVVTHRVRPEDVDAFLTWQERLRLAESKFRGYRGAELFRPIEGVQVEWTAMYRYDTAADLEAWLTSDERKQLLVEGKKFHSFKLRTVDNSFGSWFAFDDEGNRGATTVGYQDVRRGLGRPLPHRHAADSRAVAVEDANLDWPTRGNPVVQLRHQLRDDALLRQPAAETLATAAGRRAGVTHESAGPGDRHGRHGVLGRDLLPRHQTVLEPALTAAANSGRNLKGESSNMAKSNGARSRNSCARSSPTSRQRARASSPSRRCSP